MQCLEGHLYLQAHILRKKETSKNSNLSFHLKNVKEVEGSK
jgi:hypothetical protein